MTVFALIQNSLNIYPAKGRKSAMSIKNFGIPCDPITKNHKIGQKGCWEFISEEILKIKILKVKFCGLVQAKIAVSRNRVNVLKH